MTLRLSEKNRGRELEVSVDGRRTLGVGIGTEVRVLGEECKTEGGICKGGVLCVMRAAKGGRMEDDDGWVGGLNGLLKFNYSFGDDH